MKKILLILSFVAFNSALGMEPEKHTGRIYKIPANNPFAQELNKTESPKSSWHFNPNRVAGTPQQQKSYTAKLTKPNNSEALPTTEIKPIKAGTISNNKLFTASRKLSKVHYPDHNQKLLRNSKQGYKKDLPKKGHGEKNTFTTGNNNENKNVYVPKRDIRCCLFQ